MKREIKFRAWDKINKKIILHREILEQVIEYNGCFDLDDFTIMQYTGLKDKNGKGIYEGDILKYEDNFDEDNMKITYIKWKEAYSGFLFSEIDKDGDSSFYGGIYCPEEKEIIGNIHENPELLTNPNNEASDE